MTDEGEIARRKSNPGQGRVNASQEKLEIAEPYTKSGSQGSQRSKKEPGFDHQTGRCGDASWSEGSTTSCK